MNFHAKSIRIFFCVFVLLRVTVTLALSNCKLIAAPSSGRLEIHLIWLNFTSSTWVYISGAILSHKIGTTDLLQISSRTVSTSFYYRSKIIHWFTKSVPSRIITAGLIYSVHICPTLLICTHTKVVKIRKSLF